MDPDELLRRLRALAARLRREAQEGQADGKAISFSEEEVLEFSDGFLDLDNWILSGGFLPQTWSRQNKT